MRRDVSSADRGAAGSLFLTLGHWTSIAAILWALLAGFAYSPLQSPLFRHPYGSSFGHYVQAQLSTAAGSPTPVCLVVGLSTTRAAFAPDVIERITKPVRFIEVTSAGGSIFGVELLTSMIQDARLAPACIVLGLHSYLMKDRTLSLWPAGFLDVMGARSQIEWIPREVADERTRTLIEAERRALWPATRSAQQVSRLVRDGIFRAQRRWAWRPPLTRSDFEIAPGDLIPFAESNGPIEHRMTATALQRFSEQAVGQRLLDVAIYAKPEHVASLERLMSQSLRLAPRVIVVILPDSRYARERLSPLGERSFMNVLTAFRSPRLLVLDKRDGFADQDFDAAFHLLSPAAARFADRVIPEIMSFLSQNSRRDGSMQ